MRLKKLIAQQPYFIRFIYCVMLNGIFFMFFMGLMFVWWFMNTRSFQISFIVILCINQLLISIKRLFPC